MHISTITPAPGPAQPSPVGGTAGALQLSFGDTFAQMGAVDRGQVTGPHKLALRFGSASEAAAAAALLEPKVDGVAIKVEQDNGRPANPNATTFSAIADVLSGVQGITDARLTGDDTPVFQIGVANDETAARLDWIVRDSIGNVPVRFLITAPDA